MSNAFHFEERGDGIGLLTLDLPDKKVKTLSQAVLMELGGFVARLKERADLKGLLFRSGKPGQFIAGADLKELGALAYATKEQLGQVIDLGHRLCECFETFDELVPRSSLSFEWGWNLLVSMRRGDELGIAHCDTCSICYVFDLLSLPRGACPACLLFEQRGDVERIAAAG